MLTTITPSFLAPAGTQDQPSGMPVPSDLAAGAFAALMQGLACAAPILSTQPPTVASQPTSVAATDVGPELPLAVAVPMPSAPVAPLPSQDLATSVLDPAPAVTAQDVALQAPACEETTSSSVVLAKNCQPNVQVVPAAPSPEALEAAPSPLVPSPPATEAGLPTTGPDEARDGSAHDAGSADPTSCPAPEPTQLDLTLSPLAAASTLPSAGVVADSVGEAVLAIEPSAPEPPARSAWTSKDASRSTANQQVTQGSTHSLEATLPLAPAGQPAQPVTDVVNAPRETTGKMSLPADSSNESSVALQPPALATAGSLTERGSSPRESGATSFVTQLQAAVAFSEPAAPQVTARLSAARTEDGSRMTIELDPAELGPVEVALRLDDSGNAAATFVAERSETLQLLQRDTRALVDLLSGAGFTLDPGKLEFQLRDGQQESQQRQQGFGGEPARPGRNDQPAGNNPASVALGRGLLDLRV